MPVFDRTLKNKKIVFLDLDGTIYLGNKLIKGAGSFIRYLNDKRIYYYFLSNNSSRSKIDYVKKLSNLGISAPENRIILSTDGVIEFLLRKKSSRLYVLGTESMMEMFRKAGFSVDSSSPDYVILGYDTELTYEKLKKAALFLLKGVPLIATHCDLVCPTPEGPIPDVGSMLALLERATGKKPVKIFGKPNAEMVDHIIKKHKAAPSEILMIGDRIYTDMELAHRINCDFILVLSGESNLQDIKSLDTPPSFVAESIGHIIPSS